MRIGIDARFFGPRQTGIGRYVERLISHLQRIDQRNDYVVFLRREGFEEWEPQNPRWTKSLADIRWYSLAEQRRMPGLFRRHRLDLVHIPHFNVPLAYRQPFVVTIHDLILDQFPTERASTLEPLIFWMKFAAYKVVVRNAIQRAAHVITVSEHSRRDVVQRFRIPSTRTSVTYESVDPLARPVSIEHLQTRGVKPPYLLHVGNSYPHKNLENLLQAWKIVQQRQPNTQLVLVGPEDYFSKRLKAFAEQQHIQQVMWYGFASEEELSGLYHHARAYVFPSLSEGFGLPGLEAMSAGTPVLASRASCLPEIFGTAADYFDPQSPSEMASVMLTMIQNDDRHQRFQRAGFSRLEDFSWERMASQTLSIYDTAQS